MYKQIIVLFFFLLTATSQISANVYRYRLYLDGKPDSQPIVLTDRALERRQRLQIEIDETDYEVSSTYLQQLRDAGLTIITRSRWLNTVVVMQAEGNEIPASKWTQLPFVTKVETVTMPDVKASSPTRAVHNVEESYSFHSTLEDCTTPLREVNAYDALYKAGYRGQGKYIAILDGGFLRLNESKALKDKVVFAYDLYNPLYPDSTYSRDAHGVQCLSVMACPEAEGVCGTATEAEYALFCTESSEFECSLEEDMWLAAAEMADSLGADIISSSLGYNEFDNNLLSHTPDEIGMGTVLVSQGAHIASQKGILVVNAAGNEGNKNWQKILFPADVEEVLAVGAYTPQFEPAVFTSVGMLAPYVKPNVSARGTNCYTLQPLDDGFGVKSISQGTSFSTPLIAGLCASLWSAVPELTPEELRHVVEESSSDYLNPTEKTGYGLPDFAVALTKARELKGYSGIEEITIEAADGGSTASNGENQYYNLFGQRVPATSQGVIIEQKDGQKKLIRK